MDSKKFDLTQGDILRKLVMTAIPIMGTAFVQMTHNLIDMFWLSRLSSESVAAAGSGGMYLWLSMGLLFISRMGSEIGVSQNVGKGNMNKAQKYAQNAFLLASILGIVFMLFLITLRVPLIHFLNIQEREVIELAQTYLVIIAFSIPFMYVNAVFTGMFNGFGNTKIPFYINTVGVFINMILSPVLIFPFGLGLFGAAVATSFAQIVMFIYFVIVIKKHKNRPFEHFHFFSKLDKKIINRIFKWGIPMGLESTLFTIITMISSRFVAEFGFSAIAVQRIGSQIESLTWLIGGGFASAVTAFIGQNSGAQQYARMHAGFKIAIRVMLAWGAFVTLIMLLFPKQLFMIFLSDPVEVQMGIDYLRVFALMQITMCLEGVSAGAFRGRGLTIYPSIVSIIGNATRIPLTLLFVTFSPYGLNGIWMAFTIGGLFRGTWLVIWYLVNAKKLPKENVVLTEN